MTASDFEQELKEIDPQFSVIDNPNRPGLSNIFYGGQNYDLPVLSTNDIKDEVDPSYIYEFPNGYRARLWSKPEIMSRIEQFLRQVKSKDFKKNYEEQ